MLYVDVRSQIGSVASANLGQRTFVIITALAMRKEAEDFYKLIQRGEVPQHTASWVTARKTRHEIEYTIQLLFLVFQEDMI